METIRKPFRPKARIMELLGEQLIKNHTLALFELVKNAYDADASMVNLTLQDVEKTNGKIIIDDNGTGMDLHTVLNIWMEPAHGHKSLAREEGKRTSKGRLPVGEKGVGRFAVHRLGRKITMITKKANCNEVIVEIDWETFAKHEYLDEADVKIEEREPKIFTDQNTGTKIIISNLKQNWKRGDVRKLYRSVSSMTPARLSKESTAEESSSTFDFNVNFTMKPPKNWLNDLFDPDMALSQSLFQFDFNLTDEGLFYNYHYTPYDAIVSDYKNIVEPRESPVTLKQFEFFTHNPYDGVGRKNRIKREKRPLLEEDLGIGSISGRIIGFDLDKNIYDRYLKDEAGGLSDYLRTQGGIRVYRDNLRVYNYGEPGDDWLNLDHRRIQSPTKKMGNQQLLGEIHLSLDKSRGLKEKTNREGFVENDSYNEFVFALLCVLAQFEAERNKDKRILKDALETPAGKLMPDGLRKKSTDELLADLDQEVLKQKNIDPSVGKLVKKVISSYRETRDAMLSSAGAGLGLVTVFHELERGVRNLHRAISDGIDNDRLRDISDELISLLQGAMYMVSNKEKEKILASTLIKYAISTQQRRFKRHKITLLNGFENLGNIDFYIKGVRRMLTSSLVNIIDNAIYWIDNESQDDREKYIWIGLSNELEGPAIIVADSGPGFIDGADDIIQPFFTRKPSGMGIGLYYADMVMKSHKGRLSFPSTKSVEVPSKTNGACIAFIFDNTEKK
jgi:anti-sigma regulatory factor (Ser/Thr protein kinase)